MLVHDWPLLQVERSTASPRRARVVSACIVGLAHAVLGMALLWTGAAARKPIPSPQPIMIDMLPATPKPPDIVINVKATAPEMPVAAMPDFVVDLPPRNAISVQTPPGTASAATPAVSGTARDTYFARLIAYLEARKRYPSEARRLHIEGVVQLHFRIDRMGNVLGFDVRTSSGRPILDDEAKALIARARPLPPMPSDWHETELDLIVPVEFKLR